MLNLQSQNSSFFYDNTHNDSMRASLVDSIDKLPTKLKMQRVKIHSKDLGDRQSNASPDKISKRNEGLEQTISASFVHDLSACKDLDNNVNSTYGLNDSSIAVGLTQMDIGKMKLNRDENGKLKLKISKKAGQSSSLSKSHSRNQSTTNDANFALKKQGLVEELQKQSNLVTFAKQIQVDEPQKKALLSTLDNIRQKHQHKALLSVQESTIQHDASNEKNMSLVKNNNYTQLQVPISGVVNLRPDLKVTPSMVMQNQQGNIVYLCSNHQILPDHLDKQGFFYCMQDRQFLCETCIVSHCHHRGLDSVKNHLVAIFDEWHTLLSHAQNVTQSIIATNTTKCKEILLHLKRNSLQMPDIDVFTLRIIYQNLHKRLQRKVNQIRKICKNNDLDQAIKMHIDLAVFVQQIKELEDRASITGMFSTYMRCNRYDEDLKLYAGLNSQRQYYLLRKQFDDRMRKLAHISLMQRIRIQKYEHYVDHQMEKHEAQQTVVQQDFESQFNNIFQQKIEEIKGKNFVKDIQMNKRTSCFSHDKNIDILKSRDSIQMSSSVRDINEMIDSLNKKYSQRANCQENNPSRISQNLAEAAELQNKVEGVVVVGGLMKAEGIRTPMSQETLGKVNVGKANLNQGNPNPSFKPSLRITRLDKFDNQRKSQPVQQIRIDDQRRDNSTHQPTISGGVNNQPTVKVGKKMSVTSQISDFNQSVQRNLNYESIMKSTRQKIIQSHMMQSAHKQKPYLLRLSSIFGDNDTSPVGQNNNIRPNQSSIDINHALKKMYTKQQQKRRDIFNGFSPLEESPQGINTQIRTESQKQSSRAPLQQDGERAESCIPATDSPLKSPFTYTENTIGQKEADLKELVNQGINQLSLVEELNNNPQGSYTHQSQPRKAETEIVLVTSPSLKQNNPATQPSVLTQITCVQNGENYDRSSPSSSSQSHQDSLERDLKSGAAVQIKDEGSGEAVDTRGKEVVLQRDQPVKSEKSVKNLSNLSQNKHQNSVLRLKEEAQEVKKSSQRQSDGCEVEDMVINEVVSLQNQDAFVGPETQTAEAPSNDLIQDYEDFCYNVEAQQNQKQYSAITEKEGKGSVVRLNNKVNNRASESHVLVSNLHREGRDGSLLARNKDVQPSLENFLQMYDGSLDFQQELNQQQTQQKQQICGKTRQSKDFGQFPAVPNDIDEICSRINKFSSQLRVSKSSKLVDWSDRLKNMEIKDVLDIDIANLSQERSSTSSLMENEEKVDKSKSKSRKKSSGQHDDSFTQYLEKLQAEDDHCKESLDLNYNLDQLGSYQSCYIDNKMAAHHKNLGPVPDDIITHLDYLDEGVLIMQQPVDKKITHTHAAAMLKQMIKMDQNSIQTKQEWPGLLCRGRAPQTKIFTVSNPAGLPSVRYPEGVNQLSSFYS